MRRPEPLFAHGAHRLAHILRVIKTAQKLEAHQSFGGRLILAASYHDIGYAESLIVTGYHPIDGALVARGDGLDPEITDAVLHHSGARAMAQQSRPELMCYYGRDCRMMHTTLSRALTFCDTHSGPRGELFTLTERLDEIRIRHAANADLLSVLDDSQQDFQTIETEFMPLLRDGHIRQGMTPGGARRPN